MVRVRKIAHASYDVPDVEQQADYYSNILGMTVAAKEKDATFLANTVDHHSVVLRKGTQAGCVRVGFQLGEGQANTPLVFVSIVMLTVVGAIAYLGVILVERRVLHYLPARQLGGNL